MKFKVKSELDITGVVLKLLIMLIGFGILGAIIMLMIFADGTYAILSPLFIIFYSMFVVGFISLYIVKTVINSIILGSLKEESKIEKLLLKILKEIEISNGNVKTYIEEDDSDSFEKERRERELELENEKN